MTGMRQTGYSLRPATGADAPTLKALVDAAYGHYVARIGMLPGPMCEDYEQVIATRRVTVAEIDGAVVGVVVLAADDEGFCIENVAVAPSHQRPGAGEGAAPVRGGAGSGCRLRLRLPVHA
jgi:N-acetylglutamate synthase-like GNAT family acetyltransferase